MDSSYPISLPEDKALRLNDGDFDTYLYQTLSLSGKFYQSVNLNIENVVIDNDHFSLSDETAIDETPARSFMDALKAEAEHPTLGDPPSLDELATENKTLTDNAGVAFKSTKSELVDLFSEMEKAVDGKRLGALLDAAWAVDKLATLKIVFNARSIHLGKGERETFMQAMGWMKDEHPRTVLVNLPWVYRAVIEKKAQKKTEGEEEALLIEEVGGVPDDYDAVNGVSHGYWKDLLNLLVLSAEDKLHVRDNPRDVLNKKNEQHRTSDRRVRLLRKLKVEKKKDESAKIRPESRKKIAEHDRAQRMLEASRKNEEQRAAAKATKHADEVKAHETVLRRMEDPFHHALHLSVARLFASQLKKDVKLLTPGSKEQLRSLTYCAKWAPSLEGFHDKHTLIATSIAELLFPSVAEDGDSREMYLKRAREAYRRNILSPLRKALEIVERDITAETFENIKYPRVPSIAMDNYKGLFIKKDFERFEKYIDRVAEGKSRISGAVLMPAPMVKDARNGAFGGTGLAGAGKDMLKQKIAMIQAKAVDGQWRTLVQRIKTSGSLESAIAVCDVSGSMSGPYFPDRTCPMDSSIGLALLLAEIVEPPFGGAFITFDNNPRIMQVGGPDDGRSFTEKVQYIANAPWGGSTNFVAVFEDLLLPLAVKNKLTQEKMVKKVFVFSDMQFNQAGGGYTWETAYERIKRKFEEAGYVMPELIFWNLAGGRRGDLPKPVEADTEGTSLVSGYSQALMKVFLENGGFEDVEEEEVVGTDMAADEAGVEVRKKKKDPLAMVKKAIGHKAYDMLEVVD